MRKSTALVLALVFTGGCGRQAAHPGGDGGDPPPLDVDGGVPDGYFASGVEVSGQVIDFETGQAVTGAATLTTAALLPPPSVTMSGGQFVLHAVPPYSVFFLVAGSPPDYRTTYNVALSVVDLPLTDVKAEA